VPPVEEEYLPAPHFVQSTAPPAAAYLPASQSVQAAGPAVALSLPVGQAVHVPPSSPEKPGLQVQSVSSLLPATEVAPGMIHVCYQQLVKCTQ